MAITSIHHGSVCATIVRPGVVELRGDARMVGAMRLALRRALVVAEGRGRVKSQKHSCS